MQTGTLVSTVTDNSVSLVERHAAYEQLVLSFQDMAYGSAYAVLGDAHLAQDAAQNAFVVAWQKLANLREPDAFPGWFRRIVLTESRRRSRKSQTLPLEDSNVATHDTTQASIENAELKTAVHSAIAALPLNERLVVTLFYLNELSQSDIAAFLSVPPTTVAKRLYTARIRLKGSRQLAAFKKNVAAGLPSRSTTFADKVRQGLYDDYVGRYRFEARPDLVVTIRRTGDGLISEAAGQRHTLLPNGRKRTELKTLEFDGRGRFIRNRRGRISRLVYYEFGQELGTARKIA